MSRYGQITGSKKISEDYQNINNALDNIEADVDAKAAVVNTHIGDNDIHVTAGEKQDWNEHVADEEIHVTAAKKAEWDAKADGSTASDLAEHIADETVHVTEAEHTKLAGIEAGAQVNQFAFAAINTILATSPTDTVTFKNGTGIAITYNPTTREITWTATGESTPGAHGDSHDPDGSDPIPALVEIIDAFNDHLTNPDAHPQYAKATDLSSLAATVLAKADKTYVDDQVDLLEIELGNHAAQLADLTEDLNGKADKDAALGKFKSSSAIFNNKATSQTFTDNFCTVDSLVTVVITSTSTPKGNWTVNSANESFTITSSAAESTNITFDYYIQKAVG